MPMGNGMFMRFPNHSGYVQQPPQSIDKYRKSFEASGKSWFTSTRILILFVVTYGYRPPRNNFAIEAIPVSPEAGAVAVDPSHQSACEDCCVPGKGQVEICSSCEIVAFFDTSRTHHRKSFRLQTLELLLLVSFVFYQYVLASPHPKKPFELLRIWISYVKHL